MLLIIIKRARKPRSGMFKARISPLWLLQFL